MSESIEHLEALAEESRLRNQPITQASKVRIAELTAQRKAKGAILPADHLIQQLLTEARESSKTQEKV